MKIKLRLSDILFSKYIRARDNWTCQRCHTKYPESHRGLHCSHWQRRGKENTRHDPENTIALCMGCHLLWEGPTEEYTAFMEKRLGTERLKALRVRAELYKKRDDKLDVLICKQFLSTINLK